MVKSYKIEYCFFFFNFIMLGISSKLADINIYLGFWSLIGLIILNFILNRIISKKIIKKSEVSKLFATKKYVKCPFI